MRSTLRIVLWICLVLFGASPGFAGDPKNVYIKVWNGNGTEYPTGAEETRGLTLSCHLEDANNGWASSETHTQADKDFHYLVLGGSYPNHTVHHISIQCGNFTTFDWAAGDRLVVEATDIEGAFSGQSSTYTLILDAEGEQYAEPDFTLFESTITVYRAGNDLVLIWSSLEGADTYVVYRSTTAAYFTPTSSDSIATVTIPTYTDTGMLGDSEVHHFYMMKAFGASGHAVGSSNRVGEVEVSLSRGYHMLAYLLDEGYTTGQDIGASIPNCTNVLRRDAASGEWVSVAQKVAGTWINHEAVSPGYAYMIYVMSAGMWTQVGSVLPDAHFDLVAGYNMIALPLQYAQEQGIVTGQDLGESIPNCTSVLRRDSVTGKWVSVAQKIAGTWINREDVSPGCAYMAYTAGASVWP